ncbi:DUF6928 family protein [Virgisporangium aurantiacum]|uniref:Uncharacterized protein n=1 Tax=Virgisporangium aurantiacum TaxID=175570 RepID=A0A8J4E0T8_9ACTN|nr:hypothetical protein [Virgisporangium aurantiacum]GIJ57161.1 hypothetical protein Vau01_046770 [Virgisporangium aurantiacum]
MGVKVGILAFGDDIPVRLRGGPVADEDRTLEFVRRVHPGYVVEPIEGCALKYATYPPDDVVFASSSAGLDIVCDQRLTLVQPSTLSGHLCRIGDGRRMAVLGMHSVTDWLSYGTWSDGVLVRSLNLTPDSGIIESVGEPLPFEAPYWAGGHPVEDPYPLPFHPLDLGQTALRHLFGFATDGPDHADDRAAGEVDLLGFRVTDPTGAEQAARDAIRQEVLQMVRAATGQPAGRE